MESVTIIKPNFSTILHLWWFFLGCIGFMVGGYLLVKVFEVPTIGRISGWASMVFFGGGLLVMTLMLILNFANATLLLDKEGLTPGFVDLRYFSSKLRKKILWEDINKISTGKIKMDTNNSMPTLIPFWSFKSLTINDDMDYLTIFLKNPEKYNFPDSTQRYEDKMELEFQDVVTNTKVATNAGFENFGNINISSQFLPGGNFTETLEAFKKYPVKIEVAQ